VASAGAVIVSLEGTIEASFTWGLDISSINKAKSYALLQGLKNTINSCIQSLLVVGDSKVIISQMVMNITPVDNLLASVIA
jgi:ribonuclease HI